jgi:hypothetical protein
MQVFIKLNSKDSLHVAELISEKEQVNFKNLDQRERAICLVALKNCVYETKQSPSESFLNNSFNKLKSHLDIDSSIGKGGIIERIVHPISSLIKGIFNLLHLRISSKQISQFAQTYQDFKRNEEIFFNGLPSLIAEEHQKIERLKKEIEMIKSSMIPFSERVLKVLDDVAKQPKSAGVVLEKVISDCQSELEKFGPEVKSAISTHIEIINELKNLNDLKKFNGVRSGCIKKVKLQKRSFQESEKIKTVEISDVRKNIDELQKKQKILQRKASELNNVAKKVNNPIVKENTDALEL